MILKFMIISRFYFIWNKNTVIKLVAYQFIVKKSNISLI